jgi:hypothetical protein
MPLPELGVEFVVTNINKFLADISTALSASDALAKKSASYAQSAADTAAASAAKSASTINSSSILAGEAVTGMLFRLSSMRPMGIPALEKIQKIIEDTAGLKNITPWKQQIAPTTAVPTTAGTAVGATPANIAQTVAALNTIPPAASAAASAVSSTVGTIAAETKNAATATIAAKDSFVAIFSQISKKEMESGVAAKKFAQDKAADAARAATAAAAAAQATNAALTKEGVARQRLATQAAELANRVVISDNKRAQSAVNLSRAEQTAADKLILGQDKITSSAARAAAAVATSNDRITSSAARAAATVATSNDRITSSAARLASNQQVYANRVVVSQEKINKATAQTATAQSQASAAATKAATAQAVAANTITVAQNNAAISAVKLATAQAMAAQTAITSANNIRMSNLQMAKASQEATVAHKAQAGELGNLGKAAHAAAGGFTILKGAIAVVVGNIATGGLKQIRDIIGEIISRATTATTDFQFMEIAIGNLLVREYRRQDIPLVKALEL